MRGDAAADHVPEWFIESGSGGLKGRLWGEEQGHVKMYAQFFEFVAVRFTCLFEGLWQVEPGHLDAVWASAFDLMEVGPFSESGEGEKGAIVRAAAERCAELDLGDEDVGVTERLEASGEVFVLEGDVAGVEAYAEVFSEQGLCFGRADAERL